MDKPIDFGKDAAHPSGAPEMGGATSPGSFFGGVSLVARAWRLVARIARDLEATAYRRLRDLESRRSGGSHQGAPKRVKEAAKRDPAAVIT